MRSSIIYLIYLCCASAAAAQVYTHPTSGIALENVGSCLTTTCGGLYYDDGGPAGNYSDNVANTYRVFCPGTPGTCLTATFTLFEVVPNGACADLFQVRNGSTQNSPLLFASCGTGAIGPFTGTANGCLSFRFNSNASLNAQGWAATLSCAPCANGPTSLGNNDCANAPLLCSGTAIPGNSSGPGLVAEACSGSGCPAGGENYSNWYVVTFQTGGTFTFSITPSVSTDDYDYAVFGPGVSCASLGSPIRCSDSGLTGTTGLSAAASDNTENVLGDKFTAQMNVSAGEVYYIMVDEWTPTGAGYSLSFGGTASLGCVLAPVEMLLFEAAYDVVSRGVELQWVTASETDNAYFVVERSLEGHVFEELGRVQGAGTTMDQHSYSFWDRHPFSGEINYYRLRQVDFDGDIEYSEIRAVAIDDREAMFHVFPNPARDEITVSYVTARTGSLCSLSVYDSMARRIAGFDFMPERGTNYLPLTVNDLPRGVYFVVLESGGQQLRTSFVKE